MSAPPSPARARTTTTTAWSSSSSHGDSSECHLDHHAHNDTRFHPHLSSSLLRITYGPKYVPPANLLGPGSPTRSLSRPTSPLRMSRYALEQQERKIAAIEAPHSPRARQIKSPRAKSTPANAAMQALTAPTDTIGNEPQTQHPPPLMSGAHTSSRQEHQQQQQQEQYHEDESQPSTVDALSQQLENDMRLLGELKSEREDIAMKFDDVMQQLSSADGQQEPPENITAVQTQFGKQLEKYDGRIQQLQHAISESAKQMALGYQQQQKQTDQRRSNQSRAHANQPAQPQHDEPQQANSPPQAHSAPYPTSERGFSHNTQRGVTFSSQRSPPRSPMNATTQQQQQQHQQLPRSPPRSSGASSSNTVAAGAEVSRPQQPISPLQPQSIRSPHGNTLASSSSPQPFSLSLPSVSSLFSSPSSLSSFESSLPASMQAGFAQCKLALERTIRQRDQQIVEAAEKRCREEVEAVSQQAHAAMADNEHLRVALAQTESARAELAELYDHAAKERAARREAMREIAEGDSSPSSSTPASVSAATSALALESLTHDRDVIATLMTRLGQERVRYEDVYNGLLRGKRDAEEKAATLVLQVSSLQAQLTHRSSSTAHERAVLTQAFTGEVQEWKERAEQQERKAREVQEQTEKRVRDASEGKAALQKQIASLTQEVQQVQDQLSDANKRNQALLVEKDAVQARLDDIHTRSTTEHLELLTLRERGFSWEQEKDALQQRVVQELKQSDQLTQLLEKEMQRSVDLKRDIDTAQQHRRKAEDSTEQLMHLLREKERQLNAEAERVKEYEEALHAAEERLHSVELESTRADRHLDRELRRAQSELEAARRENKEAEEEKARLGKEVQREAHAAKLARDALRRTEDRLTSLSSEYTALQTTQSSLDGEVARALRQLKQMAAEKADFQQALDASEQRARAAIQAHDRLSGESTAELERLKREMKADLDRIGQAQRAEVEGLQAELAATKEKLRVAHRQQESMASAAREFQSIVAPQLLVHPPTPMTASVAAQGTPNRSAGRNHAAAYQATPSASTTAAAATPAAYIRSAATTPALSSSFTHRLSSTAHTTSAAAAAPIPSHSHTSASMLAQLAELRSLRESLAVDPLLSSSSPTSSSSAAHRGAPRTPSREAVRNHSQLDASGSQDSIASVRASPEAISSPPRPRYSASLGLRSPQPRMTHTSEQFLSVPDGAAASGAHSTLSMGSYALTREQHLDGVQIISQQVIPASLVTTTISPLRPSRR